MKKNKKIKLDPNQRVMYDVRLTSLPAIAEKSMT